MILSALWRSWRNFFEQEPESEPRYDPIHLANVLIAFTVVIGALFWLLWTLIVFEGGIGSDEGRWGHVGALVLLIVFIEALRRADRRHARKS